MAKSLIDENRIRQQSKIHSITIKRQKQVQRIRGGTLQKQPHLEAHPRVPIIGSPLELAKPIGGDKTGGLSSTQDNKIHS